MTRRLRILAALLCALALLGGATGALAKSKATSNPVIMDCLQHPGGLTGHYTVAQLNHALQVMPAETKEYTDCPDVINRARLAALQLPGGGTGSSGSFLPTPVLIILIVLVLLAVTLGAIAVRRRRMAPGAAGGPSGAGPDGPADGEGPTQVQRPEDQPGGPGGGPGGPPTV